MNTLKLIELPQDIILNEQDEIQQIIGHPPGWILKWGITIVSFVVAIFAYLSWMIKYPDVLPAQVMLATEKPAIRVVAVTHGKLEHFFVSDETKIQAGDPLGLIENAAKWEDVQLLKSFIEVLDTVSQQNFIILSLPENLLVGSIQPSYANLIQLVKDRQHFLTQQTSHLKQQAAHKQIIYYQQLNKILLKQIETFEKEVKIAYTNYKRNQQLYEDGAISLIVFEQAETQYLQYKRQLEGLQGQIVNNEVSIQQLNTQIADIQQNWVDGKQSRLLSIDENSRQIKNQITEWEKLYVLKAPIAGIASINHAWRPKQFVQANTEIFTIIPEEGVGEVIGRAVLPTVGAGKVKIGTTAHIYLDAYPYQEYGIIKAKVSTIAPVPEMNQDKEPVYLLELALEDGLSTTYQKDIPLRQEMTGTVEMITEDRRIIERVSDQLLNLLKNH